MRHSQAHSSHARVLSPDELTGAWKKLKTVWSRFTEDQGPVLAAGLTFFTLLSIVPMILVAMAILGFVMHSPHQALLKLQQVVGQALPGPAGVDAFRQLAEQIHLEETLANLMNSRGVALYTGILALVWAALQIFVNATTQMNAAFNTSETRSWVGLRLTALGVMAAAGALLILSLLPTSGPEFVRNLHIPWLSLPSPVPAWVDVIFSLVAIAINVALFTVIYRFLPARRVSWRVAAFGGVVVGILFEIAKKGFAVYLAHSSGYGQLYGPLGGVILLITWMYYSNFILLLGAEIASVYQMSRHGVPATSAADLERQELRAVYEQRAVPLAMGPRGDHEGTERTGQEATQRAQESIADIRDDIRSAGDAVRKAAEQMRHGDGGEPTLQ